MKPSDLDKFIAAPKTSAPLDDPGAHWRTLYSPVDNVRAATLALLTSARTSIQLAMYGFDDPMLLTALASFFLKPSALRLQITLDLSQIQWSKYEAKLLDPATWPFPTTPALGSKFQADPRFSLAVGNASDGARTIMHLKHAVIDSRITIHGSTNWSISGQTEQDNEMTVIFSHPHASRCGTRLDAIHAAIQGQNHVVPSPSTLTSQEGIDILEQP